MVITNNQTVMDIAIRDCGSVEAAFVMSETNDIPVTARLSPAAEIENESPVTRQVVSYYKKNNINPATDTNIEYASPIRIWDNAIGWDNEILYANN